tara:strand:- start:345 stop:680 length:336 start_codon:yes stop_codon:yes gene_type:complete
MNSIVTLSIPSAFFQRGKLASIHVKNVTSHSSFHNNNKRQKLTKALRKIGCDLEKTATVIATFSNIPDLLPNQKQYSTHKKILWQNQDNLATATATATATQDQILAGTADT